jgi:hypothetical protein
MDNDVTLVLVIGAMILVVALIFYAAVAFPARRRKAWETAADRMGFSYRQTIMNLRTQFKDARTLAMAEGTLASHCISGVQSGVEIMLSDFSVCLSRYRRAGIGKSESRRSEQGLCILSKPGLGLPGFLIREEHPLWDRIGKTMGLQDINFPDDEEFSRAFFLQGSSPDQVRAFFSPDFRQLFLKIRGKGWQVEGCGDSVFLVFPEPCDPATAEAKIDEALSVLSLLNRRPVEGDQPSANS